MTGSTNRVVITGAASGIGREIALLLAAERASQFDLLDVDRTGMEETAHLMASDAVRCHETDLTDAGQIARTFGHIGQSRAPIDQLFNCAGIPAGTPGWPDTDADRIGLIINLNLTGTILCVRAALPYMRSPGGSILNMASTSGLNPYLSGAVYAASKAAVIMFTRSCADLFETRGIRVNALCPGMVNTPFLAKTGVDGQIAGWLQQRIDTGAVLSAETVAEAAIRLARKPDAAGTFEVLTVPEQIV